MFSRDVERASSNLFALSLIFFLNFAFVPFHFVYGLFCIHFLPLLLLFVFDVMLTKVNSLFIYIYIS